MAKRNTDTVPAMLTPGEFVIKKEAVDAIGTDVLHKLNQTGELSVDDINQAGSRMNIGGSTGTMINKIKSYQEGGAVPSVENTLMDEMTSGFALLDESAYTAMDKTAQALSDAYVYDLFRKKYREDANAGFFNPEILDFDTYLSSVQRGRIELDMEDAFDADVKGEDSKYSPNQTMLEMGDLYQGTFSNNWGQMMDSAKRGADLMRQGPEALAKSMDTKRVGELLQTQQRHKNPQGYQEGGEVRSESDVPLWHMLHKGNWEGDDSVVNVEDVKDYLVTQTYKGGADRSSGVYDINQRMKGEGTQTLKGTDESFYKKSYTDDDMVDKIFEKSGGGWTLGQKTLTSPYKANLLEKARSYLPEALGGKDAPTEKTTHSFYYKAPGSEDKVFFSDEENLRRSRESAKHSLSEGDLTQEEYDDHMKYLDSQEGGGNIFASLGKMIGLQKGGEVPKKKPNKKLLRDIGNIGY